MTFNFGLQEVVSTKATAAPGWAYVADTGINASVAALQPASRKRARNQPITSHRETTAKQDARILRELAILERENHRDVSIPVPVRHKDVAVRSLAKSSPTVRKILQSQKTFANHLSDFEALSSSVTASSTSSLRHSPIATVLPQAVTAQTKYNGKRGQKKGTKLGAPRQTIVRKGLAVPDVDASASVENETGTSDAPILKWEHQTSPKASSTPAQVPSLGPHWVDSDPLLVSNIPPMPPQEVTDILAAAITLSYNEAKGPWTVNDKRKPTRHFCEVCGYWGMVKCTTCGGRICALECLRLHHEECIARYSA